MPHSRSLSELMDSSRSADPSLTERPHRESVTLASGGETGSGSQTKSSPVTSPQVASSESQPRAPTEAPSASSGAGGELIIDIIKSLLA